MAPTETTPLRGERYLSDAQKRKRIVGITGFVVVVAAVIVILWLTLGGHHSSKSSDVTAQTTPEPTPESTPALRTEAPTEAPTKAPAPAEDEDSTEAPTEEEDSTEAPAEEKPRTDAPAKEEDSTESPTEPEPVDQQPADAQPVPAAEPIPAADPQPIPAQLEQPVDPQPAPEQPVDASPAQPADAITPADNHARFTSDFKIPILKICDEATYVSVGYVMTKQKKQSNEFVWELCVGPANGAMNPRKDCDKGAIPTDAALVTHPQIESGYITLANNEENHYFYWFFESRNAPTMDPLVLWLTGGGSGCSSLLALLSENGPCRLNSDLTTALNVHSWTTEANVIWLDQPTNVGFSYGSDTSADYSEENIQKNIYWFLQGFLNKHPELEGRPLFLAGEGYASHYIPAAAHYIWSENRAVNEANATIRLNLRGTSIGNGLINPFVQVPHTLDMAVQNSYNISLLNSTQLAAAKEAVSVCEDLLGECRTNTSACTGSVSFCSSSLLDVMTETHRNKFDIRKECAARDSSDCYNTFAVADYLNSKTVRSYLNVSDQVLSWQKCSNSADPRFLPDLMKNFDGYVTDLLNDGSVRVLIYNGDADLVCNWYGSQAWTKQLDWVHQQEFNEAKEHKFLVPGDVEMVEAGSVRAYKTQFNFVRIFNSGHMVPKDQPMEPLMKATARRLGLKRIADDEEELLYWELQKLVLYDESHSPMEKIASTEEGGEAEAIVVV
ncbi:hypothetical protein BBJ29_006472 [Phytophthora kernoviae]|uniref:Carboxypeptidase n=1 Tax=Phytophthora kernoviae TaxID=325452 RepID=A0A3F2RG14_9STRA|nr:hypothetical protein BBP00_00008203 [Phytophthora kernoviae]RLN61603.1 hypothetical protein BBJ29_006472 [Phytophthora kernoviae]